jgi:hypothetical protein
MVRHGVTEPNRKSGTGLSTDGPGPVRSLPAFIAQVSGSVRAGHPQT